MPLKFKTVQIPFSSSAACATSEFAGGGFVVVVVCFFKIREYFLLLANFCSLFHVMKISGNVNI